MTRGHGAPARLTFKVIGEVTPTHQAFGSTYRLERGNVLKDGVAVTYRRMDK